MRLIKVALLVFLLNFVSQADEKININFKDLKIMDLVKITSKIIDKNILVTEEIKGNVDFISTKPLEKKELVKILIYSLEAKGFTIVQSDHMMRIVKLTESAKNNVPVMNGNQEKLYYQMVTEIFPVHNANADYIASKIRHLISKTAKLVTNKDSNTLVITDFKDNITTIKKVVSVMTYGAKKSIEIIELENIKASEAKKNLDAVAKSIFNDKIETEKVSIIANADNNSLVIVGKNQNIKYLKKYVKNIDSNDSLVKRVVEVISLKNVEASNVIKIIDGIIGKKKYLDPNAKPLSSVDEESNSIVLMGPSDEIEYITNLIEELDKDKLQVYVEAKIIEVSENRTRDIGLKYGFGAGTSGSNGIFSFASNLGGNILPLQSLIAFDETLTKGLALGATLNLLKQNQAIDIVSEPSILCINNKESSIYVGETKSFQTSSITDSTSLTTSSNSFKREDVGLTLKVKPRISNENKVTLEIEAILEDARELKEGQTNPDTTKKEVKTSAIVTNGEAVIIGGLIKNKSDIIKDDVPFFSDIPVLGNLFKNNRRVNDKINLVVIVTPYIIPKSKDLTFIRNQLGQLSQIEDRYTKELVIRLEENKLNTEKEDLRREKRKEELKNKRKDFLEEKAEFEGKSFYEESNDSRTEHEKRVAEILGN
jgi:general secretion pathway protein D